MYIDWQLTCFSFAIRVAWLRSCEPDADRASPRKHQMYKELQRAPASKSPGSGCVWGRFNAWHALSQWGSGDALRRGMGWALTIRKVGRVGYFMRLRQALLGIKLSSCKPHLFHDLVHKFLGFSCGPSLKVIPLRFGASVYEKADELRMFAANLAALNVRKGE